MEDLSRTTSRAKGSTFTLMAEFMRENGGAIKNTVSVTTLLMAGFGTKGSLLTARELEKEF